ncbi:coiled-coil domain-containing protein R3HCC1L-like [Gigantopelta aegis]|uniref:coiled-coil domain-containing protein R3HCC1L-like n=1 Tax=Gigantopelta aegis TaxID=1735272 RepID=UPI001B88B744|nr:coiled-coil domain-containing protein R3HCC1L-like [Gigantopelta aegis]XP_041371064.1 coiled-coil domain-containing protein R3HCC1L-like [Gigantopelta aegis]
MSSTENWSSRCGRGRGRARDKAGNPSPVGRSFQNLASGDDITDSRLATGHVLPQRDGQESARFDNADHIKKRIPLTSRKKSKKPEIQVYVPRAKRLQQQQDDSADRSWSEPSNVSTSDISQSCTQQKNIKERKGDNHDDKPVSARRKIRPEMQRYVPRGKRELVTSSQDNGGTASAPEKESDFRRVRTEKLSSRTGPIKKLKIGENGEEFSSMVPQNSEHLTDDLTDHFGSDDNHIAGHHSSPFTNTDGYQEKSMEVNVQEMVTSCPDLNISQDSLIDPSDCNSSCDGTAAEQSRNSNVSSEVRHMLLKAGHLYDSNVHSVSDIAGDTDNYSTSELICHSANISSSKYSEVLECSSLSLSLNLADVSSDIDLQGSAALQSADSVPACSKHESADSIDDDLLKSHGDARHDFEGTIVESNPDICHVEDNKDLGFLDVSLSPVDSGQREYSPNENEASLDVLCSSSIPDRGNSGEISTPETDAAACAFSDSHTPSLSSWRSLGAAEPPESGKQVLHSSALPDVVVSTMEPKPDGSCVSTDNEPDTVGEPHQSSGRKLTSIALKQLDNVTEFRPSSDDERMNSTADDSQSGDEDGWEAMFDDNGDCLDPDVMEQLTAHVGNVQIDKPKINYLKFETKDPELDMEEYSHVIEIYDFPSEFKTGDLIVVFKDFLSRGFDIKWVDDTHALGVFANKIAARDALGTVSPLLKVRQLSEASKQSKLKAKKTAEFLQPYKARPQTSAVAARRLVSGALGIQASIPREKRELERKQLKEAKEKRKQARQQKQDIWDGSFGKCAMDDGVN